MGVKRVNTGSEALDLALGGGYEIDVITTLYGPAGSGKTNLCLLGMIEAVKNKKKVIYIDTEGGFSLERLRQLTPDYVNILDNTLFFKPMSFEEQKKIFDNLKSVVNDKIGLIIVDSLSMLYRLERDSNEEVQNINRELSFQISTLTFIARNMNVPVILTSQVYSSFDDRDKVNIVGGDILKYGSKCLIELQKLHKNKRKMIVRKHRSLPENDGVIVEIREEGIFGVE